MSATDFEKQWGIPAQRVRPLVGDSTADLAVRARAEGRALTLTRGYPKSILLYAEHSRGGHTGDFYIPACPTCDPEGAPLSESELRLLDGNR